MHQDLIYDVGMHNGDDTAYYIHLGYRVVAIEANPQLVTRAVERFREHVRSGQLQILNVGIAEQEGELPFWICEPVSEWSSFDRSIASRNGSAHYPITVRCRQFGSILEEFGIPYYLKIDIEGNDFLCVQELSPDRLPRFISVEAGGVQIVSLMAQRGFKRFKAISQINFIPIELPPSAEQRLYERVQWMFSSHPLIRAFRQFGGRSWLHKRFRRHGNWTFPHGSSGPFGDALPGRWLSHDEVISTLSAHARAENIKSFLECTRILFLGGCSRPHRLSNSKSSHLPMWSLACFSPL